MHAQPTKTQRTARGLLKIGGAGATIAAIAALFVISGPDGEVKPSQADIADFGLNLKPRTNTERFVGALERLGHEAPRPYSYNGQRLYFSTGTSRKRPYEAMLDYQQELVNQGVNERIYRPTIAPDPKNPTEDQALQLRDQYGAMLTGQLTPLRADAEGFVLQGALMKDRITTIAALERQTEAQVQASDELPEFAPDHYIRAHRYIEGNWNEALQKTVVTATWSDEDNFEISKLFKDGNRLPARASVDMPACAGCTVLSNFSSESATEPYANQIVETKQSPRDAMSFYDRLMQQRGWGEDPSSAFARKLVEGHTIHSASPERVRELVRGDQRLIITGQHDGDGTTLSTFITRAP